MNIIEKKIDEVIPYEKNPRRNDHVVRYVVNSIREFGFKVPIVIDKNNVIICGHTRWKAAKRMKMKTIPCLIADDLNEEQIKAFRLADNKLAELAEWDKGLLDGEISDLVNWDLSEFGFDNLAPSLDDEKPKDVEEDDFDVEGSLKKETGIHVGDIFILGNHRLMCGDSTNAEHIAKLMNGNHAEMIFTSPPYSDMRTYEGGKDLSTFSLSNFVSEYKKYCNYEVVNLGLQFKDNEVFTYWNDYIDKAHACGMKLLAWNIWDKKTVGTIGMQKHMFPVRHEWMFIFGNVGEDDETEENVFPVNHDFTMVFGEKPKEINKTEEKKTDYRKMKQFIDRRQKDGSFKISSVKASNSKFKKMESVVNIVSEHGKITKKHPATFPVNLPASYIQAMTNEGENVIEPFGGSGTTLIACEQLNRKCFCMELEPKYVQVIIDRWEEFTKQKAVRENGE